MPEFQKLGMHKGLPVSVQPVPERKTQSRFPDTGSQILLIGPTISFGTNTTEGRVDKVGYGLEILGGVEGLTVQTGGTGFQTHTVSVTFLVGGENETGALRVERTFIGNEVFDGAILAGRFEQIRVRWQSTGSPAPSIPLRVRVFHQPLRTVTVMPPKPQGLPIIDFFDGVIFQCAASDLATTLYNDGGTVQPLLFRDANAPIGRGLGGDYRMGPHFSMKRRLIGRVWFPAVIATAQYRVHIDAEADDGSFIPWAHFVAVDRPDRTVSTWDVDDGQMVSFTQIGSASDAGSNGIGDALYVPGKIRIRAGTTTDAQNALAGCAIWLTFLGG